MAALIDITGQRFGRLVVLEHAGCRNGKDTLFRCRCDCGAIGTFISKEMRTGHVRSCGCLKAEIQTGVTKDLLYGVWSNIVQRCENPNNPGFHHYGGRGIYVSSAWSRPEPFIVWAKANGHRKGLEIDRIDNDGPYSPENCRVTTRKANCKNTRRNRYHMWRGESLTVSELSERSGIHHSTISHRLYNLNMTAEQAVTLPRNKWHTRRLLQR